MFASALELLLLKLSDLHLRAFGQSDASDRHPRLTASSSMGFSLMVSSSLRMRTPAARPSRKATVEARRSGESV